MVTVNTNKELKEAILAGKSPISPGNKRMKAMFLALKEGQKLCDKLKRIPTKGELTSVIIGMVALNSPVGAFSEPTIIALAIIGTVGAISIIATCMRIGVRLKFNNDGTISLETFNLDSPRHGKR